jgi:uncharacterized protein YwgA
MTAVGAMEERLNRMDLLLLLLFADGKNHNENEPIEGKTRLQKELFLSQKLLKDHKIEKPYSFRPYHYGPYCRDIYSDIDLLKSDGVINEEQKTDAYGGIVRVFSLTCKGISDVREMIKKEPVRKQFDIIRGVKQRFNSMSVVDLVNYTHTEYADYVGKRY